MIATWRGGVLKREDLFFLGLAEFIELLGELIRHLVRDPKPFDSRPR